MQNNIHIIGGRGHMGRWLKTFLENNGFVVTVSGSTDTNENSNMQQADCVMISVPIKKSPEIIKKIATRVKKDCLLIDLSSITTPSVSELEKTGLSALAMHCMFGPAITSIANQKIVFIEVKTHPLIKRLKDLFTDNHAQVLTMTAEEHDTATAYIQALTHFINLVFATTLEEQHPFKLTTPAFLSQYALMTRILSNNSPELLTHIQLLNPYFLPLLKKIIEKQQSLLKLFEQQNEEKIEEIYTSIQNKANEKHKREPMETKSHDLPNVFHQSQLSIGYLGPEGTFSHLATKKLFDKYDATLIAEKTLYDIFQAVASHKLDAGVVPAENSTEGTVRETLDYLMQFNLHVNGSIDLPIHHCLMANEKNLSAVKTVIAHPQTLAQCREWLITNMQHAKLETAPSNMAGVARIKKEKGIAIIGPEQAANMYHLSIIAKDIQDNQNNMTRFYIISRNDNYAGDERTLLFVSVLNRVGVLRDILNVFGDFGINLNKIESRPSKEKNWDYYFYIEIDRGPTDPDTTRALDLLHHYCESVKILGGI